MPASVKVASSNGDVDTHRRQGVGRQESARPYAPGFQSGFVTHYNDSQEAYKKMRDLAAEFPNISKAIKLPEQTRGYQRQAQTMLGYTTRRHRPTATAVRPLRRQQPARSPAPRRATAPAGRSTVVLTSKACGHLGGNSLAAQIVDPGAARQPGAERQPWPATRSRISPATNATGAITSTAAQVVAAINAHPRSPTLVKASLWRTNAGAGVVAGRRRPRR